MLAGVKHSPTDQKFDFVSVAYLQVSLFKRLNLFEAVSSSVRGVTIIMFTSQGSMRIL